MELVGPNVAAEKREHFGAWHRFLLLTAAPALAAALALALAPESPRFLLEAGRDVEAMMVYQCEVALTVAARDAPIVGSIYKNTVKTVISSV
ncbi:Uncharacterized protein GBIM_18214 [Gryllus bimaculatus]|nr:Uncharacterized protein GBIM_18214 [Gryllus bimaculatus]